MQRLRVRIKAVVLTVRTVLYCSCTVDPPTRRTLLYQVPVQCSIIYINTRVMYVLYSSGSEVDMEIEGK
jgi:hypothetical protein